MDVDESHHSPASKKRKRDSAQKISCELCKARKVKCDKAEPACSWCREHGRLCVYKERQTMENRLLHSHELEAKINRLNALVESLGQRVESHIAREDGAADTSSLSRHTSWPQQYSFDLDSSTAVYTPERASVTASSIETPKDSHETWAANMRGDDISLSTTGRRPSQAVAASTSIPTGASAPAEDSVIQLLAPGVSLGTIRVGGSTTTLTTTVISHLPPDDVLYTLVDLYFKHVNTWCPILDRKTAFANFFGSTSMSEADRVLLYAIVATTLRFFKDQRLTPAMKVQYYETAVQKVQLYALSNITVEALRALLVLSLDFIGTSNGLRASNLLGLLVQSTKQLRLGMETRVFLSARAEQVPNTGPTWMTATTQPGSWIEDEGRRRLCWMVYLLDRYATMATGTADFMLDDSDMQRHLPCSYDLFSKNVAVETRPRPRAEPDSTSPWSKTPTSLTGDSAASPDSLGSFSYHCEIMCIHSRIHNHLKTPLDVTSPTATEQWRARYHSLDAALNAWLQSLPGEYSHISELCHSDPASRVANWFMLHSVFVIAVIRLHSAAAYPAREVLEQSQRFGTSYLWTRPEAMDRCLTAVASLRHITQDVYEAGGLDLLGPPFAFALWTAGRLLLVDAAATGRKVDDGLGFFVQMLTILGRNWEVAGNYAEILGRMLRRARQEGQTSFGEMRQAARELVALTCSVRASGTKPAETLGLTLDDFDAVDVFELFDRPKLPRETLGTRTPMNETMPMGSILSGPGTHGSDM